MDARMQELVNGVKNGDVRAIARSISIVENELPGHLELLQQLHIKNVPVIGITGPPGAGKSTLVNSLLGVYLQQGLKVAVLAIDPTSPFNFGSILGDRIRMAEHFNHPDVFIRSLATRGSLGGLSAKTIEITDLLRSSVFDRIIVETVGVGQSEVEVMGLADSTVLVLVPEAGDEVQSIKSGIMEIADIFVLNKSDRPGAERYLKNLMDLVHEKEARTWNPRVVKAVAIRNEGVEELVKLLEEHHKTGYNPKKSYLLAEKAFRLIQQHRCRDLNKKDIRERIEQALSAGDFNLYRFIELFY